jgi:hypothetical protein
MKPCTSWACERFISAAFFVGRRGVIIKSVLDSQAGVRTFEKHLGRGDEYLADLSRSLLIVRKSKYSWCEKVQSRNT